MPPQIVPEDSNTAGKPLGNTRKGDTNHGASKNNYRMIWPGAKRIFTAMKRKFGEKCVSRMIPEDLRL